VHPANSIQTLVGNSQRATPRCVAAIALVTAVALAGCNVTVPQLAQSTADKAAASQTGTSGSNVVASAPASTGAAVVAAVTPPATGAPGCERLPTMSDKNRTTMATAAGAAVGVFISLGTGGTKTKHHVTGALGGALVGALASSAFKNEIDVEEQPDGSVRLKIPGSVMFASGQSAIGPGFQSTLASVTGTVRKYCGVTVRVIGHTDSAGVDAANQVLSVRRARAVTSYMQGQGFDATRLAADGMGESQPVADNGSELGRQQNRRVEIFVRPPAS